MSAPTAAAGVLATSGAAAVGSVGTRPRSSSCLSAEMGLVAGAASPAESRWSPDEAPQACSGGAIAGSSAPSVVPCGC